MVLTVDAVFACLVLEVYAVLVEGFEDFVGVGEETAFFALEAFGDECVDLGVGEAAVGLEVGAGVGFEGVVVSHVTDGVVVASVFVIVCCGGVVRIGILEF